MGSTFRQVGDFKVVGWSQSGFETCVVVKRDNFAVCFDIGLSLEEAVNCDVVFISHGHIDHIGGLPQHARKRELLRLPPARYYMPRPVVEPMRRICQLYADIHGDGAQSLKTLELIGVEPGQTIQLSRKRSVEVFPTVHRVPSVGFLVRRRQMKRPLSGAPPALPQDHIIVSEIAYLGDTAFSVFLQPPLADLLHVELLITEMTYIDRPNDRGPNNPGLMTRAREYGHSHLREMAYNAPLFDGVGHILLIHFSKRYTAAQIYDCLHRELPPRLRNRVIPATMALDCFQFLRDSSQYR